MSTGEPSMTAAAPAAQASWKARPEGGGRFALLLIVNIAIYCGRGVSRLLLYPITLYFLLRRGPERRASRDYLGRVFGRPARLIEVARHIHCFASTILDRVFLLSGDLRSFDVHVHGVDVVHEAMDDRRGVLLLGSHLGSFDVLRVLSERRPDADVRVLLDTGQNPIISELFARLNPRIAAGVIDASQDGTAIVLAIREAADAGALIGLLGDRARAGEAALGCTFLGDTAAFPVAPMLIASALKIPVMLCFGLYRGGRRYDLYFECFAMQVDIPRAQRAAVLAELTQRYAARLEHYTRLAPYNWFNFYDFWQETPLVRMRAAAGDGQRAG